MLYTLIQREEVLLHIIRGDFHRLVMLLTANANLNHKIAVETLFFSFYILALMCKFGRNIQQ